VAASQTWAVRSIEAQGATTKIVLSDGADVSVDQVLVAVGATPEVGWLAGSGADTLYVTGTAGTILTGGVGHDTFAFPNAMGHDVVTNFGTAKDTLQFNATLFSNFTAAMNHASQSGANTVFTIDANDTVTLDNVTKTIVPFRGFDLTANEVDLHLLDHGSSDSALDWADGAHLDLRASPEHKRWVVWTLAGRDFVCVEPWTARANALNDGTAVEVPPGGAHETTFSIGVA